MEVLGTDNFPSKVNCNCLYDLLSRGIFSTITGSNNVGKDNLAPSNNNRFVFSKTNCKYFKNQMFSHKCIICSYVLITYHIFLTFSMVP